MVEVHKVSGSPFDGKVYLILDEVPVLIDAGMDPEPMHFRAGWSHEI